jgi:hypothetical protein
MSSRILYLGARSFRVESCAILHDRMLSLTRASSMHGVSSMSNSFLRMQKRRREGVDLDGLGNHLAALCPESRESSSFSIFCAVT